MRSIVLLLALCNIFALSVTLQTQVLLDPQTIYIRSYSEPTVRPTRTTQPCYSLLSQHRDFTIASTPISKLISCSIFINFWLVSACSPFMSFIPHYFYSMFLYMELEIHLSNLKPSLSKSLPSSLLYSAAPAQEDFSSHFKFFLVSL